MTFDRENLKPLYRMVIGEAGECCAFYIAERLGMPLSMLRRAAREAYGDDSCREGGSEGQKERRQGDTGRDRGKTLGDGGRREECPEAEGKDGACAQGQQPESAFSLEGLKKEFVPRIERAGTGASKKQAASFRRGDSVMVYPDRKIGIVCEPVNDKGVLRVQLPGKKIWISHKRVKLQVAAEELYPEDYDFSIIFDTVENRKLRHQMERKYVEGAEIREDS